MAISVATLVLLVGSLRRADWSAFRQALPDRPRFYLLFLIWHFWLPARTPRRTGSSGRCPCSGASGRSW
ncbi:MAG: hypothetical protein R2882_06255 [Gemmatimonadales bacterium]